MSWDYSENDLVQESAGELLKKELGWDVVFAYDKEVIGGDFPTLGRQSYKEVVLSPFVKEALRRLNPWMNEQNITDALSQLTSVMASNELISTNENKYHLIRDGIKVSTKKSDGSIDIRTARLIDFDNVKNNHFLAVKEMKIYGEVYHRRTDIVGFVNGIPLLFIELKRQDVDVSDAYFCNYKDYLTTIPQLFYFNAFLMLSNGLEAKVGTLGSKYEFFHEWKRLSEDEEGNVALETMLRGICKKENFLDLLENYILFDHSNGKVVKILARNHQYLGVNEAFKAYLKKRLKGDPNDPENRKLGVFWHTQGSGKSYSMLFLSQKIRRKCQGSPTIVVLTDRDELNTQICDTFSNCGLLGNATKSAEFIAKSGKDLEEKLHGNPSFIFSLIHKFNNPNATPIIPDHEIILMSDEAHRTQNGVFAENMCRMLPTASRIGFTGTPLFSNDNITERTFGGYVSIYDFKRAVEDHATVPLYFENRGEKMTLLENPEITDRILDAIEAADIDESQQERLEKEFAKEIHILTAEKRLRAIAQDFVEHYTNLWQTGKAMFVCLNKVSCVRMYNFVQEYWKENIKAEEKRLKKTSSQQEAMEIERKLNWLKETEMCVVVSQEQNEIDTFQKWGLDIIPHRKKMEDGMDGKDGKKRLDKRYKDENDPFRIVFVCAMWLTGFDVKSLSCLYIDKMMKAHNLMQTLARANRVSEGKTNGLVIDYIGIVGAMQKALADYTGRGGGETGGEGPAVPKELLLAHIRQLIAGAKDYLAAHDFKLSKLVNAVGMDNLHLLQDAANKMLVSNEVKKTYQSYAYELQKLWYYINVEDVSKDEKLEKDAIIAIYNQLTKKRHHNNYNELMKNIHDIINENLEIQETQSGVVNSTNSQYDVSKINFSALQKAFGRSKTKNLVLNEIEEIIEKKLSGMLDTNSSRIDFYHKYQEIIDAYNRDKDKAEIEKLFIDLMNLANQLDEEQKRYIREGFDNEEELALFDILYADSLTPEDVKALKAVAKDLLKKIKAKIAEFDNWVEKQETQSAIKNLIRATLFSELPDSCFNKTEFYSPIIFEHVVSKYGVVQGETLS